MRTLTILTVLVAVLLSGFSAGTQRTGSGVMVPLKFDGVIITNPSAGYTVCTPVPDDPTKIIAHSRTGFVSGNQSHGGRLITEQSTWTITECDTDSKGLNTSKITGVNTVANRDKYFYTCTMKINLATMAVELEITVTGGTGKLEGVTGYITLVGTGTESGIPVRGEGFLILPK
jgi:hypothetical protein